MASNLDFAQQAPGAEGFTPDHPAAAHLTIRDRATGQIAGLNGRHTIAVCGFASSSRHRIPFDNPDAIICTLNQLYRHTPRSDVHFDLHREWRGGNVEGTDHPKWVKECGIPVYLVAHEDDLTTTLTFPIDRLIVKHGVDYFTSTVAFMVAWAIDQIDDAVGPDAERADYARYTIGIYGIDLIVGTEYEVQKACVEFWLGVAEGRGIHVDVAPESALLKQRYRYGYQSEPEIGLLRMAELQTRQNELNARKNKLIAELQTLDGAAQENAHVASVLELRMRGGQIPLGGAG